MSKCKYYKQQKQVSYDSGQTWSNVSPAVYQVGNLYEMDSIDCSHGSSQIRWVVVPGDYLCDGKDKYVKEIEQYSVDGGETWLNVYPTTYRKGRLIESDSNVCDNKWEGHYIDDTTYDPTPPIQHDCPKWYKWVDGVGCVYVDPVKIVRCSTSSSTTLTSSDITYTPYKLIYGFIGDCVTTIGQYAFSKSEISNIRIPSGVTLIDSSAFSSCTELETCIIDGNATSGTVIGDYAFYGCGSLTSIDLPDTVTSIGYYAFSSCTGLTSANIPSGSIGDSAFNYCTGLTSCTLGNGVTSIGTGAFYNCGSLTSIVIPSGVTSIGYSAFFGCSGLTSCTIGSGVTSISDNAFYGCSSLTSVNIPSGVTSIGNYAFSGCFGLTGITILAPTPPSIYVCAFCYTNCPIYVPCDSLGIYLSEWSQYASRIEAIPPCETPTLYKIEATYIDSSTYSALCSGTSLSSGDTRPNDYTYTAMTSAVIGSCVTSIGADTFNGFTSLSSVTIPGSVTSIGTGCFNNAPSLTGITLPAGITHIYGNTFSRCTSLSSVNIPNGVTSIGIEAFFNCISLSNVSIPDSVTSIGASAFENCSGLTQVTIPSGVTAIESGTFQGCSSLTSIDIPSGVTAIDASAFQGCSSLTSIDIPSGVTYIRSMTFYGCASLTSVTIPNTVIDIGIGSFGGCSNLTGVTIPNSVSNIDGGAFVNCSGMTSVTFGTGLTTIDGEAFKMCTSLTGVSIPDNVTNIGTSGFSYCSGMTSVTIGSGVTTIGHHAFSYCSGLTSITCLATTPPTLEKNQPYGQSYAFVGTDCPIYVPSASVNAYKSASEWSRYSSRIEAIP